MNLAYWSRRIAAIDARIRPPETLDEAGNALLAEIVAAYPTCDDGERGEIRALCDAAEGLDPRPALREAATLSSDVDKYGMGSTRALLLGRV